MHGEPVMVGVVDEDIAFTFAPVAHHPAIASADGLRRLEKLGSPSTRRHEHDRQPTAAHEREHGFLEYAFPSCTAIGSKCIQLARLGALAE